MICKANINSNGIRNKNAPIYMLKIFVLLLMFWSQQFSKMFINAEERFAVSSLQNCNEINKQTNCSCRYSSFANNYEVACSKPDKGQKEATFKIQVPIHRNFVKLICWNIDGQMPALPALPDLNVGKTSKVFLEKCPLQEMGSFSQIFSKLNLTNVKQLEYESGDFNFSLTHLHLNGLQNFTYISLVLKNSVAVQDALLFQDLGKLEKLSFKTYQLQLPANFFAPLKNLELLEVNLYNIKELPNDVFRSNQKVRRLSILFSKLTQLPKGIFANLTALKTLSVFGNAIQTLEANIFDDLSNVNGIFLNSNHIEELPQALFAYTKRLEAFTLANNHAALRVLPFNFLADLPLLKTLKLSCRLESIGTDTFVNSTMIEIINLEENRLSSLPENLFLHQKDLLELDLSRNQINELPENLFMYNTKLRKLTLTNNQIEQLTSDIFKSLTALELLMMDNNRVTTIDANAFVALTSLNNLQMQNNSIKLNETPSKSPFHALESLTFLNLCHNNIDQTFFENNFIQASLTQLELCFNNISFIDISKLQRISNETLRINLANNRIETIIYKESQDKASQTPNPHITLDLQNNPFNCDCKLLEFVKYLQRKDRKDVQLKSENLVCQAPKSLHNKLLPKLLPAELSCLSKYCPPGCKCFEFAFSQIIFVECNNLKLTSIPDLKPFLNEQYSKWAIELNLENNNLTKLPNMSITDFKQISSLKLAGNKLSELVLENLPQNLTHLDLRNNSFEALSNEILGYFEQNSTVKFLQLSGNPWQCNCSTQPLLEYVQRNFKMFADLSNIRCDFSGESVRLHEVNIADLCAVDQALIISLSIFTILLILFVISAVLFTIFNTEIKVWLYSNRMCLWLITKAEPDEDKIYDAFISYSSKDEHFVVEQLVPILERGCPSFKVCVHYRDFLVGQKISVNIANAVENSRRTIIVLSKNFIQADWTLHEFRFAHLSALEEKKPRVIIILYDDIGEIDDIDPELQAYLNTKTYLEWKDTKFWDRLRYALPHPKAQSDLIMNHVQNDYAIANGTVRA